jgi:hypothetical protein
MKIRSLALLLLLAATTIPAVAGTYDGTVVGSPTFGPGAFGNGMTFTNDANFVRLPYPLLTGNTFTIEIWLKTTSTNNQVALNGTYNATFLSTNAGHFVVAAGGFAGGAYLDSGISINDGNWHVCDLVMISGQSANLYVDGVLGGSFSGSLNTLPWSGAIGNFQPNVSGFSFNGAIDEVSYWNYPKYTGNFTPPSSPYTGFEPGLVALYHLQADGTDSTAASPLIDPTNSSILYSPGNWSVTSGGASTINPGAYFSVMFTGSSVAMNFNVANLAGSSEIYYRIDGYEAQSPFTESVVASTITPAMPSNTTALPYHLLEVVVKSMSDGPNRWNIPSQTAVILTGITLSSGASVAPPMAAPGGNVLVYGDSITEGVATVNATSANDTDQNDAMMGWAYDLRKLLGVEVGVIGFAGTGYINSGAGNVPGLQYSYGFSMQGATAPTVSNLKMIVINDGQNDGLSSSSEETAAVVTVLNGLISKYPNVPIVLLETFSGGQAPAIQAAIPACSNPSQVSWVGTTGFFNPAFGGVSNVHPSGPNNLALVGPKVAGALENILYPSTKK